MGLLTGAERASLIDMLLRLPNITDGSMRRSLVAGLPEGLRNCIEAPEIASIHVANIVDTADGDAWAHLVDDSWSIIRVVENAIATVRGSRLERELDSLLDILKSRSLERAHPQANGSAPTPPTLAGEKFRQVEAALLDALPRYQDWRMLVRVRFDRNLDEIAGGDNLKELAFNVLIWAESEGRVDDLVAAARLEKPGNLALRELSEQLGLAPASPPPQAVESVIRRNKFFDVEAWHAWMSAVEAAVCRVEVAGAGFGTGFLVGPSTVMTCEHIVSGPRRDPAGRNIVLRFGLRMSADGSVDQGTVYHLADDWLLDSSPVDDLDYALLRVQGSPGDDPQSSQPGAPPRRWLRPVTDHVFRPNDPLIMIQHPEAGPLKITIEENAIVGVSPDLDRVWYRISTAPGSGGSPCFSDDWELVALHHASREKLGGSTQEGIPIMTIAAQPGVKEALGI